MVGVGLRIQWGNPWEFESPLAHQKSHAHLGDTPTTAMSFDPVVAPRIGPLHLAECRAHVVVGDDPIALEDADRLMPGDAHRHRLVDPGGDEVADRGAPEVVEDVGFAGRSMPSYDRALWALRAWLDS